MKKAGKLDEPLFRFTLTGGVAIGDDPNPNPYRIGCILNIEII